MSIPPASVMDERIRPFRIEVPDEVLQDLSQRLHRTRWPDQELVPAWGQGVPLDWMKRVVAHWSVAYNWRAREALLNRFDQYITQIDGLDIHFLHVRSPHPDAMPLLLSHGWPGSFAEFVHVIEPLTDPVRFGGRAEDAFHVVCPSLPGFGFSGKPTVSGWGVERIGEAFMVLMQRLGYPRYGAQGGDWGSNITAYIGAKDPDHCVGIHITLAVAAPPAGQTDWTPEERHALDDLAHYGRCESGYSTQQATRPQTLAYGLHDSPVGQAAWILEKFQAWTDCEGDPLHILSIDTLLDNVMLYWVTESAASSARLYWESFGKDSYRLPVHVPTGITVFPKELVRPIRAWLVGRFTQIVHWSEMPHGGHFAAFEQPDMLMDEIRTFFQPQRQSCRVTPHMPPIPQHSGHTR